MPANAVTLAAAQAEITNWKTYCTNKSISDRVIAVKIPMESITPLLEIENISGIRTYIGLPDASKMAGMHVFVVAIDSNGNDIIEDGEGNSMIMDFNSPCPATCDVNSPLFI
jgi:pyrroloquinoline quinone (PQQ) biosynthesis protein C